MMIPVKNKSNAGNILHSFFANYKSKKWMNSFLANSQLQKIR